MTRTTTPSEIAKEIVALLASISRLKPVYLPLTIRLGTKAQYRFRNVDDAVAAEGGELLYGWVI